MKANSTLFALVSTATKLFRDFCIVLIMHGELCDVKVRFISCTGVIEEGPKAEVC